MRTARVGLRVALSLAFAAGGCKDDGPTAPQRSTPTPVATATPVASFNLSGNWTGTMRDDGATDQYFCPPGTAPATLTITQSGSSVGFSFESSNRCSHMGVTSFSGTLMGTTLAGTIQKQVANSCLLQGSARGAVDRNHIQLDGRMAGACNDVDVHIDLVRLVRQ